MPLVAVVCNKLLSYVKVSSAHRDLRVNCVNELALPVTANSSDYLYQRTTILREDQSNSIRIIICRCTMHWFIPGGILRPYTYTITSWIAMVVATTDTALYTFLRYDFLVL